MKRSCDKSVKRHGDEQCDLSILDSGNNDSAFKTPMSSLRSRGRVIHGQYKSTPVLSLRETPVTHLCSPSLSPKSRRHIHHNAVKRVLSDSSLNSSDCPDSPSEETSNFIVGVRVRPFNFRELSDASVKNVVQMGSNEVCLTCLSGTIHSFSYDHCFWSVDTAHSQAGNQEKVFQTMVMPLLEQLMLGYNACLLAYGQTGSGKSYSMMGLDPGELGPEAGVIPRFCNELFNRIASHGDKWLVEMSYFEIYNEKIHDLLGPHEQPPSAKRAPLRVREHPVLGPYVVDLSAHCIASFRDVQGWLRIGNSRRVTADTGMNEKSSRSHSIFTITVTKEAGGGEAPAIRSRINLVDLAGSERLAQTNAKGDKLKEGVSINKSLLSLGKVITFLSEKSRRRGGSAPRFGPYRESVLTWLLRESLGGNSRTAMLATISPASIHLDETLATLRYACQARSIVNRVHKNEDSNERIIRELRAEVEKITALREELERMKRLVETTQCQEKQEEIERLKTRLSLSEDQLARSKMLWSEKLTQAETLQSAELQYLKRCGVAVELHWDRSQPCLVNLALDPILTGTLLYLLPPGRVVLGRGQPGGEQPDIVLEGALVEPHHCDIENKEGSLYLHPLPNCTIFVNGFSVQESCPLRHGDRLVIAGSHYFRVSNQGAGEAGGEQARQEEMDFLAAREELLRVQERKLRDELEKDKQECERELDKMMVVLEMQKDALDKERQTKNHLEVERNVLQARVTSQEQMAAMTESSESLGTTISPYSSTLTKDLNEILSGTSVKMKLYWDGLAGEVSSQDWAAMTAEASLLCEKRHLPYEFELVVKDEEPFVLVMKKAKNLVATWQPARFLLVLASLRDDEENSDLIMRNIEHSLWSDGQSSGRRVFSAPHTRLKPARRGSQSESETDEMSSCLAVIQRAKERLLQLCTHCHDRTAVEVLKMSLPHLQAFLSATAELKDSDTSSSSRSNRSRSSGTAKEKTVRFHNHDL